MVVEFAKSIASLFPIREKEMGTLAINLLSLSAVWEGQAVSSQITCANS
jgi:hypothetical protein